MELPADEPHHLPSPEDLRSYADDADQHGNHWVPISPASLRGIAGEIERLRARLDDAMFVMGMVDKNNRIDAGEKGKAWSGRFVVEEVRRVLALGPNAEQRHGVNCEKAPHHGGNLHSENDETPFEVDGVHYCGRCHKAL